MSLCRQGPGIKTKIRKTTHCGHKHWLGRLFVTALRGQRELTVPEQNGPSCQGALVTPDKQIQNLGIHVRSPKGSFGNTGAQNLLWRFGVRSSKEFAWCVLLEIKPMVSHMLSKYSTFKLHSEPQRDSMCVCALVHMCVPMHVCYICQSMCVGIQVQVCMYTYVIVCWYTYMYMCA